MSGRTMRLDAREESDAGDTEREEITDAVRPAEVSAADEVNDWEDETHVTPSPRQRNPSGKPEIGW